MYFIKYAGKTERKVIVDSSLCGMGRGAGNAPTELVANYLNLKYHCNYDMNAVMDAIDTYMSYFQENYTWGYSTPYFIAGMYCCHVNNIAYLQVDLRYNGWLMRTIGERYAIEYTLDRMKQLGCKKMVAGIYRCKENEPVIRLLKDNGIQIIMSDDEDVNSRFLNIAIKETADYVVRVCADQVLFDFAKTNEILDDMKRKNKELFYNPDVISVLPDIVRIDVLKIGRAHV